MIQAIRIVIIFIIIIMIRRLYLPASSLLLSARVLIKGHDCLLPFSEHLRSAITK